MVVVDVVVVVVVGAACRSWVLPWRDAAPGPGRSPTPSMVPLNVGGMQNTLTSVCDAGAPPVAMGPAGAPFSVITGGAGCLIATAWVAASTPALRRYRRDHPPAGHRAST